MATRVKPFATLDQQMDLLQSRGLLLDREVAGRWLQNVGYYRLSGYWYPWRAFGDQRRLDQFSSGTTFDSVVTLYEFDRKLRTPIHDGVERVEVALRSRLAYVIGQKGALSYHDAALFRPGFDHTGWLATARARAARSRRHSEPVRHHEARYGGELPIWVLTEVLDFADVSRLYEGLVVRDQWSVAEGLGVLIDDGLLSANQRGKARKAHPLVRWFEQLTVLRNTCAHHARVWNRSFAPVSTVALRTISELRSLPEGQSERLYGALIVMAHLLQTTSPDTSWPQKVRAPVDGPLRDLSERSEQEMGFPPEWRGETLWATTTVRP